MGMNFNVPFLLMGLNHKAYLVRMTIDHHNGTLAGVAPGAQVEIADFVLLDLDGWAEESAGQFQDVILETGDAVGVGKGPGKVKTGIVHKKPLGKWLRL